VISHQSFVIVMVPKRAPYSNLNWLGGFVPISDLSIGLNSYHSQISHFQRPLLERKIGHVLEMDKN